MRSIAESVPLESRVNFAQSFCFQLIAFYWELMQETYAEVWMLPDYSNLVFGDFSANIADNIPKELARSASRLDILEGGHIRSELFIQRCFLKIFDQNSVYFTPLLSIINRLLGIAENCGINWAESSVLDPACGGGAFPAPVAQKMWRIINGSRAICNN